MTASATKELELALRDHNIGFVLNEGEQVIGHLRLKQGALIHGYVDGGVECESGSVIITETGCVRGDITADRVIVEGSVKSRPGQPLHQVMGRELISVASVAFVEADLCSKAFSIHSTSIKGGLYTLSS